MYTTERNIQIVISLLKAHGIRKVVASPGTNNLTFVASIQHDPDFEMYSCIDERSAAYMACGMAAESGEPVVLMCTGATASRNYMPGLTEAYYRKLPILALTSCTSRDNIGQLISQQIDRSSIPNDIAIESVYLPLIKDKQDERVCEREANKAILALKYNGGGPVHVDLGSNLATISIESLPPTRTIKRYTHLDCLPDIPHGRICIMLGTHKKMSYALVRAIDNFCATYDAVVLTVCPKIYCGRYAANVGLLFSQFNSVGGLNHFDICVHIGEVNTEASGFYIYPKEVWRVSEDGIIRDVYGMLTKVFQMSELEFFQRYAKPDNDIHALLDEIRAYDEDLRAQIPNLPFGTAWIAQTIAPRIPKDSDVHLGILNSVRAWDYANPDNSIRTFANTGGYGIDGCVSTMIGASLVAQNKQFYGIFGDLAFFYDMNVLGNRHVGDNLHIMLINNDGGQHFRNVDHPASSLCDDIHSFVAAAGHNGTRSRDLVRHFVSDLGFRFISANNKEEFLQNVDEFLRCGSSVVFEVYTSETEEEGDAFRMLRSIAEPSSEGVSTAKKIKRGIKNVVGTEKVQALKTLLGL